METAGEIIEMMRIVPPGQHCPDAAALRLLRELTRSLIAATPGAAPEHARFLAIGQRGLCLPEAELAERVRGASILVTGGTGCIGSALMRQLALRRPGRLVSVSRGVLAGWLRSPRAEYLNADVRDRGSLGRVIRAVQPDVLFHLAAQRDPGLAELAVHRTVTTNVLGTRNVLAAAAEAGVAQVVCASTGKALRPYSPDMYTASKRAAEWVAARVAATSGVLVTAARFTHVVDNSIIYQRLLDWADGGVIRLHAADIAFYAQSASESAQLLLVASLGSRPGQFRVHAINDLGWPVSLLDLALGVLARTGSTAPVYFSGYDRGYEEIPFPGLYDPATAGEVSPLLNAFEAVTAERWPCPRADSFQLAMAPGPGPGAALKALEQICRDTQQAVAVRAAQNELSWSLLDATLRAAPAPVLARAAAQAHPHRDGLNPEHRRMLEAIREHAGIDSSYDALSAHVPAGRTPGARGALAGGTARDGIGSVCGGHRSGLGDRPRHRRDPARPRLAGRAGRPHARRTAPDRRGV